MSSEAMQRLRGMIATDSSERLSLIKDHIWASHALIVVLTETGEIIDANDAAHRMFGYLESRSLLGKSIDELVPPGRRADHSKHRESFQANPIPRSMGASANLKIEGCRRDGSFFPAQVSLQSLVLPDHSRVTYALVVEILGRGAE